MRITRFGHLEGHTIRKIELGYPDGLKSSPDEMRFTLSSGAKYRLFHEKDCTEDVWIKDIVGDLDDLVGSPLHIADESSNENATPKGHETPDDTDSYTWTCYRMATNKGYVTIWWYGESNGYYSESVDFAAIGRKEPWDSRRGMAIKTFKGRHNQGGVEILEPQDDGPRPIYFMASLGAY